jgi:hypothetical protein
MAGRRALIVVPPFIKYNAGPLLGPHLLQAAARSHGHSCSVLDLNALWIQRHVAKQQTPTSEDGLITTDRATVQRRLKPMFQGDHNKPLDNTLSEVEQTWNSLLLSSAALKKHNGQACYSSPDFVRRLQNGFFDHEEMKQSASNLAFSPFGEWAQRQVCSASLLVGCDDSTCSGSIDLVGLSLLHAGQLIPAAAISLLARRLWPQATIVWGGPHISGLGEEISVPRSSHAQILYS